MTYVLPKNQEAAILLKPICDLESDIGEQIIPQLHYLQLEYTPIYIYYNNEPKKVDPVASGFVDKAGYIVPPDGFCFVDYRTADQFVGNIFYYDQQAIANAANYSLPIFRDSFTTKPNIAKLLNLNSSTITNTGSSKKNTTSERSDDIFRRSSTSSSTAIPMRLSEFGSRSGAMNNLSFMRNTLPIPEFGFVSYMRDTLPIPAFQNEPTMRATLPLENNLGQVTYMNDPYMQNNNYDGSNQYSWPQNNFQRGGSSFKTSYMYNKNQGNKAKNKTPNKHQNQMDKPTYRQRQKMIQQVYDDLILFCTERGIAADPEEHLSGDNTVRVYVSSAKAIDNVFSLMNTLHDSVSISKVQTLISMKSKTQKKGFIIFIELADINEVPTADDIVEKHIEFLQNLSNPVRNQKKINRKPNYIHNKKNIKRKSNYIRNKKNYNGNAYHVKQNYLKFQKN